MASAISRLIQQRPNGLGTGRPNDGHGARTQILGTSQHNFRSKQRDIFFARVPGLRAHLPWRTTCARNIENQQRNHPLPDDTTPAAGHPPWLSSVQARIDNFAGLRCKIKHLEECFVACQRAYDDQVTQYPSLVQSEYDDAGAVSDSEYDSSCAVCAAAESPRCSCEFCRNQHWQEKTETG